MVVVFLLALQLTPGFDYPYGHPYHHSNFQYNGAPLGAYQPGHSYPEGHPYHHHHGY